MTKVLGPKDWFKQSGDALWRDVIATDGTVTRIMNPWVFRR